MTLIRVIFMATVGFAVVNSLPAGGSYHVHHRIHVPQKIKTIYHTKIIKVPEHHHHFHEKEKIIIEKEPPKEDHHSIVIQDDDDDHEDEVWSESENSAFYKKKRNAHHSVHETKRPIKKRRIVQRYPYKFHRP
ncbi:uncharacterized protein LOC125505452 [Dendroctonus ponderosae]|uniref:Uncharacterized protein n=1 Tax=Dendroctonus ponderosae TaxID=77166 RepID=A0AAR5P9W5_DENPD|nr:uncharacterized protein LOC109536193 [Dendroctonus ponderosae]XP_048525198.1 uncharacterized protein LOC125505449 [Dendroctonus ponderosae]XP_048525202.1 uncharacterized protein LOC125505452 [Dendroctonus ponderosae]